MWKSIWELFSAPFQVMRKGELYGYPTGRNPIRYFSLRWWALLTLLFTIFIYPLIMLSTVLGLVISTRFDNNARINEKGIEVFTKHRGSTSQYDWNEIAKVEVMFTPPFPRPELVLKNSTRILLPLADRAALKLACKENGVEFIDFFKKS